MTKLSKSELNIVRRSMGMIFQQFNLLMQRTALDNVTFPLELAGMKRDAAKKRGLEMLELVGLANRANAYPAQLSGGQKQRVAIARALAPNPKALLCDEATSALDPETTDSILNLIRQINRDMGITAVVITHEMDVIEKICHKVAIISKGVIAETGRVNQVFFHPQSDIARRLVVPEALHPDKMTEDRLYPHLRRPVELRACPCEPCPCLRPAGQRHVCEHQGHWRPCLWPDGAETARGSRSQTEDPGLRCRKPDLHGGIHPCLTRRLWISCGKGPWTRST